MQWQLTHELPFLRAVTGPYGRVERLLYQQYRRAAWRFGSTFRGKDFEIIKSSRRDAPDIGIYAFGGCDLPAVFALKPLIKPRLAGGCCIRRLASTPTTRADLLLQSLGELPRHRVDELVNRLDLPRRMFQPLLFEEDFSVDVPNGRRRFPKTVVVLSVAPNVVRSVYRDKETGLLVDPGGLWFNRSIAAVLDNPENLRWFRDRFESIGRMSLEVFRATFDRLIREVRQRTRGHIIVFNLLTVEPGVEVHNYQFVRRSLGMRLRSFNLALTALARELDFDIVDIDYITKSIGTDRHIDPFHDGTPLAPAAQHPEVAKALFHILVDRGIVPAVDRR
jgi:hypothetical protein